MPPEPLPAARVLHRITSAHSLLLRNGRDPGELWVHLWPRASKLIKSSPIPLEPCGVLAEVQAPLNEARRLWLEFSSPHGPHPANQRGLRVSLARFVPFPLLS